MPVDGRFENVACPFAFVTCVEITPVGTLVLEIPVDNVMVTPGKIVPVAVSSVTSAELGLLWVDEDVPPPQPAMPMTSVSRAIRKIISELPVPTELSGVRY